MRTDHTPDDRRTDDRTIPAYDDPVDVALEVAQDLAGDRDVVEYIRRARQARIAAGEPGDNSAPESFADAERRGMYQSGPNPTTDEDDETDDAALEDGGTA